MDIYSGGHLINKINKITNRRINELIKQMNITEFNQAQGSILFILWDKKELTIKQISKETGLAQTTLTNMLNRMEEQDLIEKIENANDKRSTLIRLKNKSEKLEKQYSQISEEMVRQYYRNFTDNEVMEFEGYLKRVLDNLEEENE